MRALLGHLRFGFGDKPTGRRRAWSPSPPRCCVDMQAVVHLTTVFILIMLDELCRGIVASTNPPLPGNSRWKP